MSSTRQILRFGNNDDLISEFPTTKLTSKVTVSWSANRDEEKITATPTENGKLESLLPPFVQTKSRKRFPNEGKLPEISNKVADIDATRQARLSSETNIISPEDKTVGFISSCGNAGSVFFDDEIFDPEGRIVGKSDVSCKDDCGRNDLTCGRSSDKDVAETKSFVEIADVEPYGSSEPHDSDYQEKEEDFTVYQTSQQEFEKKRALRWPLGRCENLPSSSEDDEEGEEGEKEDLPNTTEPHLSHQLYVPYDSIPKPRFFSGAGKDVGYVTASLPRRPRSPVREILAGKFDLKTAYKEWKERERIIETRKNLRESKDRILESLKRLSEDQTDDIFISCLVLQTICEQVALSIMGRPMNIDISVFVNVATVWALVDLELFDSEALTDGQFRFLRKFGLLDPRANVNFDRARRGGLRRTLLGINRSNFGCKDREFLHRRLPWFYVSPAHERGHTKFYPNARERIDEKLPKVEDQVRSAYVPDLTCFHLREVLDKAYVAYNRKSRPAFRPRDTDPKKVEDLLTQLVSFM